LDRLREALRSRRHSFATHLCEMPRWGQAMVIRLI
jgi:hypothetical protein